MAIYNLHELQKCLYNFAISDIPYVELNVDDITETLTIESHTTNGSRTLNLTSIPESKLSDDSIYERSLKTDEPLFDIAFSYEELETILNSINNALEYFKEYEKTPACSKELRSKLKSTSVKMRNLQAKLTKCKKSWQIR